jgi:hypothetical protein
MKQPFNSNRVHSIPTAQSGQVAVVTLLIMSVILVIAIAVSQRTAQEQQIAFTQDESVRVFNAAEGGVEEGLSTIQDFEEGETTELPSGPQTIPNLNQSNVEYTIESSNAFEMYVDENTVVEIPLNVSGDDVTINWWESSVTDCANSPPAILVSLYQSDTSRHLAYDPCPGLADHNTGFEEITAGTGDYAFQVTVDVTTDDKIMRIRPLFQDTRLQISGDSLDQAQFAINSRGVSQTDETARALNVLRSRLGAPSYMDFTLVAGSGGLTK